MQENRVQEIEHKTQINTIKQQKKYTPKTDGDESDYFDGEVHFTPKKNLGQGGYSLARLITSEESSKQLVVLSRHNYFLLKTSVEPTSIPLESLRSQLRRVTFIFYGTNLYVFQNYFKLILPLSTDRQALDHIKKIFSSITENKIISALHQHLKVGV